MKRQVVSSSNIRSVGYDEASRVLEIEFAGGIYRYQGVPREVFASLMAATSKGRYFNDHIKDRYPTSKL